MLACWDLHISDLAFLNFSALLWSLGQVTYVAKTNSFVLSPRIHLQRLLHCELIFVMVGHWTLHSMQET